MRGAPSALHNNTSVPVLHHGDCPETRREHTTRGFRGKSFTYPQNRKRALVRARAPDSEGCPARTRGACSSRSLRCLLFTDGHLVGLLRVAADPRCVPCFAPSFPESTGGPAYTRLGLFTVQPQSSEDTPRQIAHTNTHAALQLTAAAPLQWEHSSSKGADHRHFDTL